MTGAKRPIRATVRGGPGQRVVNSPAADLERAVANATLRIESNRIAKSRLAAGRAPDLTQFDMSLAEELELERPEEPWAVESLAKDGHIVSLPASRKSGKTTFTANLGHCGITGDKFLGLFATNLDQNRTLAAVNAEMTTSDYLDVWRPLRAGMKLRKGDDDPYEQIFFIHCRDNKIKINLLDDTTAERFIEWLRGIDAGWMFLDPWKNFLAWAGIGLNDNDGVNALTTRVQEIHSEAELSLTVIPTHTTQTTVEGEERAKGAGELEDGVDAMWRYTRGKGGRDAPRFLAVEGRGGAGLSATEVLWDGNGVISLGDASREEANERQEADEVVNALTCELLKRGETRLKYSELEAVVHGTKGDRPKKIRAAVRAGKVARKEEGPGKPTWYSLPGSTPVRPSKQTLSPFKNDDD